MTLLAFIQESNEIEDLHHSPLVNLDAYEKFLARPFITPLDLEHFVGAVAGAKIRSKPGMDVRVGNYVAPPGGPDVVQALNSILTNFTRSPHKLYIQYQIIHPFTDGNGRSGRALWLHSMRSTGRGDLALELGFLKCFHYATLEKASGVKIMYG